MPRLSWGGYPRAAHRGVVPLRSVSDPLPKLAGCVLPHAWGRSYGDSCLNADGWLLDTRPLDRIIDFHADTGRLHVEAGVTLAAILDRVVPLGWFLPVVPGTKWVSVGGAIANDIHGKNHHRAGTFGRHLVEFELLRSSGERLRCSAEINPELFAATIGGLGLTGVIVSAELQLQRIAGPAMDVERIRYGSLADFLALAAEDAGYEYTVAWVDGIARGKRLGRGLYLRGQHAAADRKPRLGGAARIAVPFELPAGVLTPLVARGFNTAYYHLRPGHSRGITGIDPFFFPLDGIGDWNRLYGPRGFLQHQSVIPLGQESALAELLDRVAQSGEASFLAVLKRFGDIASPGLLSFPRPGFTLALDFRFRGEPTLKLLDSLDQVVRAAGGALYPAKDARMSPEMFRISYPNWEQFAGQIDPAFSSSFWRRVAPGTSPCAS